MKFIRNIVASPITKPLYRLKIFDFDGLSSSDEEVTMEYLLAWISEKMPSELQSRATVLNQLRAKGLYVRGVLNDSGTPVIAVLTYLPK